MRHLRIGLIGCGGRGGGLMGLLHRECPGARVTVIADPDAAKVRGRLEREKIDPAGVRLVPDADAAFALAGELDGLIIATRCHHHAPMAIRAAATGLPLYLEKPVAVDEEQLEALCAAFRGREDRVVVSFPLRLAPVFEKAVEIVRSGRLGTVNQVQAVNNVPYGGHYFGGHYRNWDESGGLWLQKATHDFDYLNVLAGCDPVKIAAVTTQKIYGGDRPHDLRCSQCDDAATCPEGPPSLRRRGDAGGMNWDGINPDDPNDHWCAYSREIRNQDAGSALVLYADGTHASYTQNFVARRSAYRRGAVVTGHAGTLEFDFDGRVRIVEHHTKSEEERLRVEARGGHCGGDEALMRSFVAIARDGVPSRSPLTAGALSAAMSLAARRSSETHSFQEVISYQ